VGSLARIHSRRELRRRRIQWGALGVVALLIVGLAVGHSLSGGSTGTKPAATTGTSQGTIGTSQVTGGTVTSSRTAGPSALQARTLLRIPAASALAQADGSLFVTDDQRNVLVRFNPTTGKVQQSLHLAGRPDAMLLAGGDLWIAEMVNNVVVEVDPGTMAVLHTVAVPDAPSSLAELGADVWVTSLVANEVTPIDMQTGVVGTPVQVLGGAVRVASGFAALWVTGTDDLLTRIVPAAAGAGPPAQRTVLVGRGPIGVDTGAGFVWVANAEDGTVSQVDPTTLQVAATLPAGNDPLAIAVTTDNRVFVGSGTAQTVRIVSPAPGSRAVPLSGAPRALLAAGNGVEVATSNPGRVLSVSG
jgi:YVTN family beta-propeller protein